MGSEAADRQSPVFNQTSGNVYVQTEEVMDRYRHGVKVIFRQHGRIGEVNPSAIINAFIQGVVLLGVATQFSTMVANNSIPRTTTYVTDQCVRVCVETSCAVYIQVWTGSWA